MPNNPEGNPLFIQIQRQLQAAAMGGVWVLGRVSYPRRTCETISKVFERNQ